MGNWESWFWITVLPLMMTNQEPQPPVYLSLALLSWVLNSRNDRQDPSWERWETLYPTYSKTQQEGDLDYLISFPQAKNWFCFTSYPVPLEPGTSPTVTAGDIGTTFYYFLKGTLLRWRLKGRLSVPGGAVAHLNALSLLRIPVYANRFKVD